MRKLNVGDYVVLDMTGCWSFKRYTNTKAEIVEFHETDTHCQILVRGYDGKCMWISKKRIKRKARSDK